MSETFTENWGLPQGEDRYTADIEPLVVAESAAEPDLSQVAIAVVHASNNVGLVDVYVTAPGIPLNSVGENFSFDYKQVVDAGALPAGTYQIRVTDPGTKNVIYDSGTVLSLIHI